MPARPLPVVRLADDQLRMLLAALLSAGDRAHYAPTAHEVTRAGTPQHYAEEADALIRAVSSASRPTAGSAPPAARPTGREIPMSRRHARGATPTSYTRDPGK